MDQDLIRVVSQLPFAPISDTDFLDFPNEPPPDYSVRPPPALVPAEGFENCPLCGENVLKGNFSEHISECIKDC
jgi:hypothetical protein